MRIGPFRFRPTLWPTLGALLVVPALLALGVWQLQRAEEKRDLLAQLETARQAAPVAPTGEDMRSDDWRFRRVRVSGRFDSGRQFLLDNQVRDGQVGYRVLTPLRTEGSDAAVLVARGWRAAGPGPDRLPDVAATERSREIIGLATDAPGPALRLGPAWAEGNRNWPRRVQFVDFDAFEEALPYGLLPLVIDPAGTERTERALAGTEPSRHVGYAVQWFALAAAVLVLYVMLNLSRGRFDDR